MSRSRLSIICLAIAACLSTIHKLVARASAFVLSPIQELTASAAAFVWRVIEPALRSSSPPLAYAGPSSLHALRHEAGTSRRAADRHI